MRPCMTQLAANQTIHLQEAQTKHLLVFTTNDLDNNIFLDTTKCPSFDYFVKNKYVKANKGRASHLVFAVLLQQPFGLAGDWLAAVHRVLHVDQPLTHVAQ